METQLSAHGVKEAITKGPPAEKAAKKDEKGNALRAAYIAVSHLD